MQCIIPGDLVPANTADIFSQNGIFNAGSFYCGRDIKIDRVSFTCILVHMAARIEKFPHHVKSIV